MTTADGRLERVQNTLRILPYFMVWQKRAAGNLKFIEGPELTLAKPFREDAILLLYGQYILNVRKLSLVDAQNMMEYRFRRLPGGLATLFEEDLSCLEQHLRIYVEVGLDRDTNETFMVRVVDVATAILFFNLLGLHHPP